jgi:hypothetical protein
VMVSPAMAVVASTAQAMVVAAILMYLVCHGSLTNTARVRPDLV